MRWNTGFYAKHPELSPAVKPHRVDQKRQSGVRQRNLRNFNARSIKGLTRVMEDSDLAMVAARAVTELSRQVFKQDIRNYFGRR